MAQVVGGDGGEYRHSTGLQKRVRGRGCGVTCWGEDAVDSSGCGVAKGIVTGAWS